MRVKGEPARAGAIKAGMRIDMRPIHRPHGGALTQAACQCVLALGGPVQISVPTRAATSSGVPIDAAVIDLSIRPTSPASTLPAPIS